MQGTAAGRPTRPVGAWVCLAALTLLAAWLRLRGLPGPWGSDSLYYVETVLAGRAPDFADRSQRVLFLSLVRGGLGLGGGDPAWVSVPGVVLSVAVVPVLWLAGRRSLGPAVALLPCGLWTFLGLDLEEVVEVSADAAIALPSVLGLWLVLRARERVVAPWAGLALAGAILGVGVAVKETMLFGVAGLAASALCIGVGRRRLLHAAVVAGAAAVVAVVLVLLLSADRVSVVSEQMAHRSLAVKWTDPGFAERLFLDVPRLLLTATGAFGLLLAGSLPLLARIPFRAARGNLVAVFVVVGLLAFDICPVSLETWAVLPGGFPRYVLCLVPALLLALVEAATTAPASRLERVVSLAAVLPGLLFVGRDVPAAVLLVSTLVVAAWPSLPERWTATVCVQWRTSVTAGLLLACVTALWTPRLPGATAVVAAAPLLLVLLARIPRGRIAWGRLALAGPVLAGLCLSVLATNHRFRPEESWNAWDAVPARGRIHADRIVARRMLVVRPEAPGRPGREVLSLGGSGPPPKDVRPDDVVIVRADSPIDRAIRRQGRLEPAGRSLGKWSIYRPPAE